MTRVRSVPAVKVVSVPMYVRDWKRFGGTMAICLCLKCGQKIDDRVEQCPYCAAPRREDAKFFQELLARLAKSRKQPHFAGAPKA